MLLLTDGTVMCQVDNDVNWWRLTPDAFGSYVNGTWSPLAPMHEARLYYASAVLDDGRVFVAGGEDSGPLRGVDLPSVEIFDPVSNSWTLQARPVDAANNTWLKIGDAPCCVLADGRLLLGNIDTTDTSLFDPGTGAWSFAAPKGDRSSEETWTLLPDGTVLTVQCNNPNKAEKYVPSLNKWVPAGDTGVPLVQASSTEIGPAILLPDGRVFAIGATGNTALYKPPADPTKPGAWTKGPVFPADASGKLMEAKDAPAVLLTNGEVLCVASPASDTDYPAGTLFFEYDGGPVLHHVLQPSNATPPPPPPLANPYVSPEVAAYQCRMLLTPSGQVLLSTEGNNIEVYTSAGAPKSAWRPQITGVDTYLQPGHTYVLHGRQLNGLSQACSYGDDATMATNYPIVRLRNVATNHVFYCRTFGHSTMGVATGASIQLTHFQVPVNVELCDSEIVVVANGIPSEPVRVQVCKGIECCGCDCCCSCDCCCGEKKPRQPGNEPPPTRQNG